jgi:6-methylsalicylate decarboxylase
MLPRHNRIDTHIHVIPPSMASALKDAGGDPTGYPLPHFSTHALSAAMKELDVQTAVLSVTTPGPALVGSGREGRELARKCNDEGMEIVSQGEGRFKLFGSTPCWTDVQGTINEIEYCMRTLKCAGIVCMTTYGDK